MLPRQAHPHSHPLTSARHPRQRRYRRYTSAPSFIFDHASSPPIYAPRRAHSTSNPYLSPQHGNESGSEADDELSEPPLTPTAMHGMTPVDTDEAFLEPSYPGEDTRPTSNRELLGFYTYSFAAEVFVVCGLGAFIPITLEDLARSSATAVRFDDRSKSCKPQGLQGSSSSATASTFAQHRRQGSPQSTQCVFRILGLEVNTASFAMYTFSLSVLLQALLVVTMSGAADHGQYRKSMMIGFAMVGAIATMLFLAVTPDVYLLGSLWAIIGNVCLGASIVLLNSFLPLLVRWHSTSSQGLEGYPSANEREIESHERTHTSQSEDSMTALLPRADDTTPFPPSPSSISVEMQLSTKISSYGVGIGYLAAVIVQIFAVFILQSTGSNLFSLRLVLFLIGAWWLSFTIPAAFLLRPRPGPPLFSGKSRTYIGFITYSWTNLYTTMLRARRLKDVLLFLTAWFMISDAIATVSGTAILFAKTTLQMSPSALALINVIVTLSGILGALTWRHLSLPPTTTILASLALFFLIPLYALLGYIPSFPLGLKAPWEMYLLALIYGLVLGGLSSYCRSLYGELIPRGSEASFYALYAITDKGSSVFGPAIVGAIVGKTGEIRPAFWFLAALIAVPGAVLWGVDMERGRRVARELAPVEGLMERERRNG